MAKSVLITGKPARLASELIRATLSRGDRVVAATVDDKPADEDDQEHLRRVPWNRSSPLSARSVLLNATNSFDTLHEAFVLYAPEGNYRPFHESTFASAASVIDEALKGTLFLIRELISYFERVGGGSINIVIHDSAGEFHGPVDACARGGLESFTNALFTYYQNEPVQCRGFISETEQPKEFAAHILHVIDEKGDRGTGKWHRYSGRGGIFARVRS
jgi:NAD(P)-dependent dehydrogenase (short-subunit alcohol dehydrogenase family)